MQCPKCDAKMELVVYEGIEVERCTKCKGMWFDGTTMETLNTPKAAAAIDVGSAATGEQMNAIDRYPCPNCRGGMVRMVDATQSHIWYEKCISCGGSFFDAGEFRDLSENTIADFFRTLGTPERN